MRALISSSLDTDWLLLATSSVICSRSASAASRARAVCSSLSSSSSTARRRSSTCWEALSSSSSTSPGLTAWPGRTLMLCTSPATEALTCTSLTGKARPTHSVACTDMAALSTRGSSADLNQARGENKRFMAMRARGCLFHRPTARCRQPTAGPVGRFPGGPGRRPRVCATPAGLVRLAANCPAGPARR